MLDRSTIGASHIIGTDFDQPISSSIPNTSTPFFNYEQSILKSSLPMSRTPLMEQSLMPDMTPVGLNPLPPRPVNINVTAVYDDDDIGINPTNNDLQNGPPLINTGLEPGMSYGVVSSLRLNNQMSANRGIYGNNMPGFGYGTEAGNLGTGMAPLDVNNVPTPAGGNIIDAFR